MPEMRVSGRRAAWRDEGEGPPVLLAHCSLAHSGLWKPLMGLLPGWRFLAPDMPGHGRSEGPPPGRPLQLHAVDICRALVEREPDPVHLVGLSLGGAVLGRLALAVPDRVASLALIEPVYFHFLDSEGVNGLGPDPGLMAEVNAAVARGDFHAGARAFMAGWGDPGGFDQAGPAGRDYYAECLRHLAPDFGWVNGFPPGQVTVADLGRLAMPVLVVSGGGTPRAAELVADIVHRAIPGARRAVIPEAGHLSPVTRPAAVAALLRAFWAESGRARREAEAAGAGSGGAVPTGGAHRGADGGDP